MGSFFISTDDELLNLELTHTFIANSYWAKGIPFETVKRSIENSLCFGAYDNEHQQVGFARVVTDKATFAYLADVFVLSEFRGLGISKLLMDSVIGHPELQGLRRMMLATYDAHGLYKKYGFEAVPNPESLMQIWQPNIYQNK
ncbi:GNAT family N-acetyltransferase [Aliikangiella marina]|uniref:GNAT family N-acetyltransferase n=1 Tax=Aliikangiella marina TaxID=1712262 RepID=A0A545T6U0_9GAMM|nr:GNAT family N-acetyltransferase [Aliikangiella marina]TQV72898.1 GNAT family N-acetyltransferase [Aliikangiella marina]